MTERLTTLTAVKDYLGIEDTSADSFLTSLIDAASPFILGYLDRVSFQVRTYTQNFRGNGKDTQLLLNWPVRDVSSVGIGGTVVSPSVLGTGGMPGSGYVVSDNRMTQQSIQLYGYSFWYRAPCQLIYTAGFRTSQSYMIATPTAPATEVTFAPTADGQWTLDVGVTIAGVDAVLVTGTPAAGQYAVDEWGVYTFAGADAGKEAVITYDYVPYDVSFAVCQLIGEWYKGRSHIGVVSKTLGGQESVTFSQKDMSDGIKTSLQPYMNVVPM